MGDRYDPIKFLEEFSELCYRHKITSIYYTTDDNGIHINQDHEEIFVGFLSDTKSDIDFYLESRNG